MKKTNVLIIGSGAREHAIGWKLAQSPNIGQLYFGPGNAGTAGIGKNIQLPDTRTSSLDLLLEIVAQTEQVDLVVIGPDQALADGLTDDLLHVGYSVFGPTKDLAKIEWSKVYAKELMKFLGIPTPRWSVYHSIEGVLHALRHADLPIVLKANGLRAGKGVEIIRSLEQHDKAVSWAKGYFASTSEPLLIEKGVDGVEASMLAFCDGGRFVLCPPAMDYKRASAETDDMTGGMGCVAPAPLISQGEWELIGQQVIAPVLAWFQEKDPRGFRGCLYAGLMLTKDGPMVLEYNARPGDPETQALLPLLDENLLEIFLQCAIGILDGRNGRMLNARGHSCCVVVAHKSYPAASKSIVNLPEGPFPMGDGLYVFQANTRYDKGGNLIQEDGRVLSVVGTESTNPMREQRRVYAYLANLNLENVRYRTDIGEEIPNLP